MSYKFAFTGGHHNSALVVAKKLKQKGHSILWLGHKYAQKGNQKVSAEYQEVTAAGIPFLELKAGKFTTYNFLQNISRTPKGLLQVHNIFKESKPDALISFGSYLGATAAFIAWFHKIPIYLHEQTVAAGKANLATAPLAKKIFLTWKDSATHFPKEKIIYTGLPLRKTVLEAKNKKLFSNNKKTLLVIGGKQGSHTLNQTIFPLIDKLTQNYNLIHQTGTSTKTGDLEKAKKIKSTLPEKQQKSYKPYGYIKAPKIGDYLKNSNLIISRSGAHITYELAALEKPCVLIPFEHTHKKEQLKNAKLLKQTGQAEILRKQDLSPRKLEKTILQHLKTPSKFSSFNLPLHAGDIIVDKILEDLA